MQASINFMKIMSNAKLTFRSIKTVSVIGSGIMGSGIAQVSAQSGYDVYLVDINNNLLESASEKIFKNLERVAKKQFKDVKEQTDFITTSFNRIKTLTNVSEAAKNSDLIIEAIIENIDIKHKLFKELDESAPSPCIFASNTSSLQITDISESIKRKDRFGGIHFFNPVPVMKLVEIVSTSNTSKTTIKLLTEFAQSLGKTTIKCRDTPGFVVNHLLVPYIAESIRMIERGDATAEEIDIAMKLGAGHPMGPLTLADYIGIDTIKLILDGWHERFPEEPLYRPIPLLDDMIAENKLGHKSHRGFFRYPLIE